MNSMITLDTVPQDVCTHEDGIDLGDEDYQYIVCTNCGKKLN
jgi:hypothetical protein